MTYFDNFIQDAKEADDDNRKLVSIVSELLDHPDINMAESTYDFLDSMARLTSFSPAQGRTIEKIYHENL